MAAAQMIEHPLYSLSAETETHLADHDEQSGNNQDDRLTEIRQTLWCKAVLTLVHVDTQSVRDMIW